MGRERDAETVWQAQEMYCVDRMTFEQVAEALGVADSTLRRWADMFDWRQKREEIARDQSDLRALKIRARAGLLRKLAIKSEPQAAYAVAAMEGLALREAELIRSLKAEATPRPQEQQALPEVPAEAGDIAALEQGVRQRLAALLLSPDLKVRDVKDLTAILERLARTAKHSREETKDGQGKEPITYVLEDGDA
jgi:transposase-like protein